MPDGAARNYGAQLIHYTRKRVRFSDPGIAAGIKIVRLPENSYVLFILLHVVTAFNSGSSDTVQLGTTASAADILAATSVHSSGLNHGLVTLAAAPGLGRGAASVNPQDIWLKWIGGGAAPSAGDLTLIVAYCPDNDA